MKYGGGFYLKLSHIFSLSLLPKVPSVLGAQPPPTACWTCPINEPLLSHCSSFLVSLDPSPCLIFSIKVCLVKLPSYVFFFLHHLTHPKSRGMHKPHHRPNPLLSPDILGMGSNSLSLVPTPYILALIQKIKQKPPQ